VETWVPNKRPFHLCRNYLKLTPLTQECFTKVVAPIRHLTHPPAIWAPNRRISSNGFRQPGLVDPTNLIPHPRVASALSNGPVLALQNTPTNRQTLRAICPLAIPQRISARAAPQQSDLSCTPETVRPAVRFEPFSHGMLL